MSIKSESAEAVCGCGGTGHYRVTQPTETRRFSDGSTVVLEGFSTRLCSCRNALPPRDGKASWWTQETVFHETVSVPIGNGAVDVLVRAEVPISADNYRVVRRGNRYYPTTVEIEGADRIDLHPADARELAAAILRAADAADGIDRDEDEAP